MSAALVRELSSTGTAVLLSSHQIGEVEDVCDGFTVLRRGQVVWNGTAAELRAQAPGVGVRDAHQRRRARDRARDAPPAASGATLGAGELDDRDS